MQPEQQIIIVDRIPMLAIAQLVRAPDCDSGGYGFDPHWSPKKEDWLSWPKAAPC